MLGTSGLASAMDGESRKGVRKNVQLYKNPTQNGNTCAVRGCHNNQRKLNERLWTQCFDHKPLMRKDCSCNRPFDFYKPENEDVLRQWKAKLNLKKPPKALYVCSFHFIDKKPTLHNPLPQLYLGYPSKVKTRRVLTRCTGNLLSDLKYTNTSRSTPIASRKRKQPRSTPDSPAAKKKQTACTSAAAWEHSSPRNETGLTVASSPLVVSLVNSEILLPPKKRKSTLSGSFKHTFAIKQTAKISRENMSIVSTREAQFSPSSDLSSSNTSKPKSSVLLDQLEVEDPVHPGTTSSFLLSAASQHLKALTTDKETQWTDISLECHNYHRKMAPTVKKIFKDQSLQCKLSKEESLTEKLIKTDCDAKLYVGVTRQVFLTLVNCMLPFAKRKWSMSVHDQILMTMMKIKLNLLLGDLARRFRVSESLVSKTVSFWITQLAQHLTQLIVWLPRETIRETMPSCFRKNYPKTTCILDCAETIMQKPNNLQSRGESYSNYKSHNTVKYCVAIAPSGVIMYISKAYGGRSSDRFIVQDCGILQRFMSGDEVMADRGFTIADLLFPVQVSLNIPAFSQGKQLSDEEVTRTRRLANVRIHVERAIRRLKVFRILKDTVPISMTSKIDKILNICAALVNLSSDLIRDKEAPGE